LANCSVAYTWDVAELAAETGHPHLSELLRRFLFDQLYPDPKLSAADVPLVELPRLQSRLSVYHSASAVFHAPSELSGIGGMHREVIRSTPSWYGLYEHCDTVLLHDDFDEDGMRGMVVGRVLRLLSFKHDGRVYQCALVEWFERIGDVPDPLTGLWRVRPKRNRGQLQRDIGIVPLNSIFRACQIIPMYGKTPLPAKFHFSHTHVAFHSFYVNSFADYHAHECIT
jgi:hypothetical protein